MIDTESGTTKGQLVEHYAAVVALMLPHLKQRPVSLLRAPEGVKGEQFFQKHAEGRALANVDVLDRALYPSHAPLLAISTSLALLSVAQMNAIELHTWNATTRAMDRPDRMVFDLDPGEGVAWPQVKEATQLVYSFITELGLTSFLKTGRQGPACGGPVTRSTTDTLKRSPPPLRIAKVSPTARARKGRRTVWAIFIDYRATAWARPRCVPVGAWRTGLGVSADRGMN